jgi:hypothetical protein
MYDPINTFITFASEKLANHTLDLSTQQPINSMSIEYLNKAYKDRREKFSQELNDKIASLEIPGSPWIEARLRLMKEAYEAKLTVRENELLINQKIREYL